MKIQQISLFVENKPGHIVAPARLLAQAGIDIRALYLADTHEYGILRMIVSDWQQAARILEAQGFAVKVTEVLAVEVADRPGGLADLGRRWTEPTSISSICMPSPMYAETRQFSSSASPTWMRQSCVCRPLASASWKAQNC